MVNTGHVKKKGVGKLDSLEHFTGTKAARKLTNTPALIYFYALVGAGVLFSRNRLLY